MREECVTRNVVYLVSTPAIVRSHIAVTQTNKRIAYRNSIAPIALICTEADRLIMNRKRHYAINLRNSIARARGNNGRGIAWLGFSSHPDENYGTVALRKFDQP